MVFVEARWPALAVLAIARISLGFQFQSVASVSPLLQGDLGLSYTEVGTLIGLFWLPGIVLAIPTGILGKRFGDTRLVLLGLVLMAVGGALEGFADGYAALFAARLLCGIGAVFLNVLLAKMTMDWFAGREVVLAMSILVNMFPVGIGLAFAVLPFVSEAAGWRAALGATGGAALLSLALVALLYAPHANDRAASAQSASATLTRAELVGVSLAGTMWALLNGAFICVLGFAPTFLTGAGYTLTGIGFMLALNSWLIVASVQAGGFLAQYSFRPAALVLGGAALFGIPAALLPYGIDPLTLFVVMGLAGGLPAGAIVALPAEVLRPQTRNLGTGIFYTFSYAGQGGLPALAGVLADATQSAAAPLWFGALQMLSLLLLWPLYRAVRPQGSPAVALR
jgi:predicted MFS family arabinose efflux permease